MLFTSWEFILGFVPLSIAVFFAIPIKWRTARKLWLSLASLFFYAWWKIEYVPLLLASIGVNFLMAEWIARRGGMPNARHVLYLAVAVNLAALGFYKYTNFLLESWNWISNHQVDRLDLVLPLAISFYTFTQIGYIVDVARDPRLHYRFVDYCLFVLYFPHLIAGPIVRHWEVIPQYAEKDLRFNRTDFGAGMTLFLIGLYKKVLLADPIAVHADAIFGQAAAGEPLSWFAAWIGTIAYAFQIYFDFSGYSDMAIGLSRLFGIRFPANFNSPYKATNIVEFWRRWHMSLTRFLREYVYFPLGGSRRGVVIQVRNVLITFLLSGLWHGAGWTFVIWGGLHGLYLCGHIAWERFKRSRRWELVSWPWHVGGVALTFFLVMIAWVFFRSATVDVAFSTVKTMLGFNGLTLPENLARMIAVVPGAEFVFRPLAAPSVGDWGSVMVHLAVLASIIWISPNSQQLLVEHDMVLDGTPGGSRIRLPLRACSGFALGVLFMLFLHSRFNATASPFLYFNF